MKGYVYLDNDRNLSIRAYDFIENQDPGFWTRNAHLIDTVWIFDSDDYEQMSALMTSFKRLELPVQKVRDFCSQAGFDLAKFLLENSTPKQTFHNVIPD
jgi:hypothetical protein